MSCVVLVCASDVDTMLLYNIPSYNVPSGRRSISFRSLRGKVLPLHAEQSWNGLMRVMIASRRITPFCRAPELKYVRLVLSPGYSLLKTPCQR